ncbi:hypothetical protein [Lacipirellula sp.]|uniref:hypothetical protein n=1 Tax=Lacipirellula sp. TaxID=2691419 RepID=UPI003D0EBEED
MTPVDFRNVTFAQLAGGEVKTKTQTRADKDNVHARAEEKIARLSQEKGRALSKREQIMMETADEGLDPGYRRPVVDTSLIAARNWKPVLRSNPATATGFDAEIARLESLESEKREMEEFATFRDINSQTLHQLKKLKRQELDARGQSAALEAHVKEQSAALKALAEIRDWARWEERVDLAQVQTIENAIRQTELYGGCPNERERLYKEAMGIRSAVLQEQAAELSASQADLLKAKQNIDRQLQQLKAQTPDPLAALEQKRRENPDDAEADLAYWRMREVLGGHEPGYFVAPVEA